MANNSWGTPPHLIESARTAMGSIDTDPASNDEAQKIVQAGVYYTEDDSGFDHCWKGNVWLNPPYGRGLAKPFIETLAGWFDAEQVDQAIVLLNTVYTSTWFRESGINSIYSAICLPNKRIAFINPDTGKPEKGNDRDQIIVYLGDNPTAFCEEFSKYGVCHLPYRPVTFI
jgi:phage N-6-adenine-methyltransferase